MLASDSSQAGRQPAPLRAPLPPGLAASSSLGAFLSGTSGTPRGGDPGLGTLRADKDPSEPCSVGPLGWISVNPREMVQRAQA